jgi:hypothetical protein
MAASITREGCFASLSRFAMSQMGPVIPGSLTSFAPRNDDLT